MWERAVIEREGREAKGGEGKFSYRFFYSGAAELVFSRVPIKRSGQAMDF